MHTALLLTQEKVKNENWTWSPRRSAATSCRKLCRSCRAMNSTPSIRRPAKSAAIIADFCSRWAEQRLAVTLGDVAGKGMPAALLMARLSSETRSCLLTERQLTAAVAKLNDQLFPVTSPMDRFGHVAIAAVLDPVNHTLTLGSTPAIRPRCGIANPRGHSPKPFPAEDDGQSLGLAPGNQYRSYEVTLAPGDFLFVYSDGVTDAQSRAGKSFKVKGIQAVLEQCAPESPRAWGERLVHAVQRHAVGGPQYDDITLVCFGRPLK